VKVFHESSNEFREYRLGKTTFQEQYVTMFSYLSCKVIVYPQTLMFRKNIINASAFVYSFGDVFIQTELLQHGQKKNLPYFFTVYRQHAGGVTNSLFKKQRKKLFSDMIDLFSTLNKKTGYQYDRILDSRLFEYKVCYKFSEDNLTWFKKIGLAFSYLFSKGFFKSPSLKKIKTIGHVVLKGGYTWNSV